MSFFEFDGKNVWYNESGAGAPPLVLLHGNTASSAMFAGVAQRYARDFNVILIDFLGHGKSDRLSEFPADLWVYEARQVITLLREKGYSAANAVGSSGGALVAINAALEAPELFNRIIADSFEGERALAPFTENIARDRELSKLDAGARAFYEAMHGADWERVVDCDTAAIARHAAEIGGFFHRGLESLKPDILLTGSAEDEFVSALAPDYFDKTYGAMLAKIGHGEMHIFERGGHPAMLSNADEFYELSMRFFRG